MVSAILTSGKPIGPSEMSYRKQPIRLIEPSSTSIDGTSKKMRTESALLTAGTLLGTLVLWKKRLYSTTNHHKITI